MCDQTSKKTLLVQLVHWQICDQTSKNTLLVQLVHWQLRAQIRALISPKPSTLSPANSLLVQLVHWHYDYSHPTHSHSSSLPESPSLAAYSEPLSSSLSSLFESLAKHAAATRLASADARRTRFGGGAPPSSDSVPGSVSALAMSSSTLSFAIVLQPLLAGGACWWGHLEMHKTGILLVNSVGS